MSLRPGSIEHWAQQRPDAQALIEAKRRFTWRQLDEMADGFARGLMQHGIHAGDVIAVRTHVRIEWVVIAGALAKIGCALAGLNWRLTAAETRQLLEDSGAAALICDDADISLAESLRRELHLKLGVTIDAPAANCLHFEELLATPGDPLVSKADPRLIIFTSGTTGRPKGVSMADRAVASDAEMLREYREAVEGPPVSETDNVALVTMPMHHASGPSQIWAAIRRGRLVVLQRRFDPEGVLALIQQHRVTRWAGVPTMFKRVAGLPTEVLGRYDVSSIQRLTVGAAPVPHALKLWINGYFGRVLQENYGATEVGMVSTLMPDMHERKLGSSGKLLPHVQVEIRDTQGKPLPRGNCGEIWVKTPVVTRGYLNSSPLEADTLDERGFFRVGDVGYLDDEDYLFITDRANDMIIAGGVNIYPAEIEAVLQSHPAILDAAVIGIPHEEFGEQVMAFCQFKQGRSASVEVLTAHCAASLATYKRPRIYQFVDDLPRNTMGKVLKQELRQPFWAGKERAI